jgi:hypothetical protein
MERDVTHRPKAQGRHSAQSSGEAVRARQEWSGASPRNSSQRDWILEMFREVDKRLADRRATAIEYAGKRTLFWHYE